LVVSNQRGGVGKTSTAATLARCFADMGRRVLLIDADSQGSLGVILGLKPQYTLYDFLIGKTPLKSCVVTPHSNIDILCSDRRTMEAEDVITSRMGREMAFETAFSAQDQEYDIVVIDVAPSLTLFQTCAMMYARQILIPAAMDTLSAAGAASNFQALETINRMFRVSPPIRCIGILPVIVDRRLQMTETVLATLEALGTRESVPLLPLVRTDTQMVKAGRMHQFLADFDSRSKALEDYTRVAKKLLQNAGNTNARTIHQSA
jgi:chromosome partitioning protein